jgi:cell division septation protein DedD
LDTGQLVTLVAVATVALGGVFALGIAVGKKISAETEGAPPADLLSEIDAKAKSAPKLTYAEELVKNTPAPRSPEPLVVPPPPAITVDSGMVAEKIEIPAELNSPKPDAAVVTRVSAKPEREKERDRDAGGELKNAIARAQRPAEATSDGKWTLQLSASQDKSEAERFASDLRGRGYAPYIVEAQVGGKGTWYRVRMGRFPSKEAATRYMTDFQRETHVSAFVTNSN